MRSNLMLSRTLLIVASLMGQGNPHAQQFHESSGSGGGHTSKRPYDKKAAAHYRAQRIARKTYHARRRLPRDHPDKIRGPVENICLVQQ